MSMNDIEQGFLETEARILYDVLDSTKDGVSNALSKIFDPQDVFETKLAAWVAEFAGLSSEPIDPDRLKGITEHLTAIFREGR